MDSCVDYTFGAVQDRGPFDRLRAHALALPQ